jgi:hypothetical protein
MAARRNSLFLTSAGPLNVGKRELRYVVQPTIVIAIVMVVLDSGIASAGACHVLGRLGIFDGPHDRKRGCLTRAVNYPWRILGFRRHSLAGRSLVAIDGRRPGLQNAMKLGAGVIFYPCG